MDRTALLLFAPRQGAPAAVPTVELAVPASDAFEADLFHLRRMMVGGQLARAHFSFVSDGTTYAPYFGQGDATAGHYSAADPTVHVPALSGATAIEVNLGSSNNSSAQVATALISALSGAGISASTNGTDAQGRTRVVIQNASSLSIPAAVDLEDNLLRGMWGAQRDDWGDGAAGQDLNADGGTNGTGSVHVGNPSSQTGMTGRDGRVLGVYIFAHTAYRPRLAAGSGPSYSTSPGAITILDEGAIQAGGIAAPDVDFVLFDEPVAFDSADELWAMYRENAGGGPRYRLQGGTPEGNGDITASQLLLWDTTATADYTNAFGSSYTPTVDNTFGIYIMIGLIFELQDGSGRYHAQGNLDTWIGDQNTDDEHGTQTAVPPATIDPETTHHRFLLPAWTAIPARQLRRAVDAIGADEDSRACFYGPWDNLTIPITPAPALIADLGLVGLAGNANGYTVLDIDVDLVAAANDYVSLGFNYVRDGGGSLATYTLPVFLDDVSGGSAFLTCWTDDRANWHDDIRGASGRSVGNAANRTPDAGASEYRTTAAGPPTDDWADTWPDPFDPDASDNSPSAIALDAYRVQRVGLAAVS